MTEAPHRHVVRGSAGSTVGGATSIFADLRIVGDDHRLHLVGDGRSLVLHSSDPRRLATDLRSVPLPTGTVGSGRRAVGRAANTLRDNGISVAVRGPEGVLINLGAGRQSRLGRLVTGSPAVSFGAPRDLAAAAGIPVGAITMAVIAGLVATTGVLARRALRRH